MMSLSVYNVRCPVFLHVHVLYGMSVISLCVIVGLFVSLENVAT